MVGKFFTKGLTGVRFHHLYQYKNLRLHWFADKLQFNAFRKDRFTRYYPSADLAAPEYRKTILLCILTDDLQPKASGLRKYVEEHHVFLLSRADTFLKATMSIKLKKKMMSKYKYDLRYDTPGIM